MLRSRIGLAVLGALGLGFLISAPAAGAECLAWEEQTDQMTGRVTIVCTMWGTEPGGGDDGGGSDTGGSPGTRVCEREWRGEHYEVPCSSSSGSWNNDRGCYVAVASPPPAANDPVWEGNTDGVILQCTYPDDVGDIPPPQLFWAASDPTQLGPSPRELADRALAQMDLVTGEIGSTPPSTDAKPGSMGLIGVPMWLWVDNPGAGTTEDVTVSESSGALTVTLTAELDRIDWTLTDRESGAVRASVACTGSAAAGTRWTAAVGGDGTTRSPTCGIAAGQNDDPGRYTLTAQAHWVATWTGGGENGEIPVTPPAQSVPIDVAELQTIVVD
jgi:hypothetical protein